MERWQKVFLVLAKAVLSLSDEEFSRFSAKAPDFFQNMPRQAKLVFKLGLTFIEIWFFITRFRSIFSASREVVKNFVESWASSRFLFKRNLISAIKGFCAMIWAKVQVDFGEREDRKVCSPYKRTEDFWEGEAGKPKIKLIWKPENFMDTNQKVVCIGNFDGIHKGHVAILKEGENLAKKLGVSFWVISFLPHPRIIINPQNFFPLTTAVRKTDILKKIVPQVKGLFLLNFLEVKDWEAEKFVSWLSENLSVVGVVVGKDFCFGKDAKGNVETLQKGNFEVVAVELVMSDNQKISSSNLRKVIKQGDVLEFYRATGEFYGISGCVVRGQGIGAKLGFPTANVISAQTLPQDGVYICLVEIDGIKRPAVANVGPKPTLGVQKRLCEVHILDFSDELYLKTVSVFFIKKIRDVKKFPSVEELKRQIKKDVEVAKKFFETEFHVLGKGLN